MNKIQPEDLEHLIVEYIPEIKDEYETHIQHTFDVVSEHSEDLYALERFKGKPKSEIRLGSTLVFEDLVVPVIVQLSQQRTIASQDRLKEIFLWIEQLACSDNFKIRNAVASGICTSLITTNGRFLAGIINFMGEKTKDLCTMQFSAYKVSDATKKLFGILS
jgi:hypothetical protein